MIASAALFAGLILVSATGMSVLRTTLIPRQRSSRLMRWTVSVVQRSGSAMAVRLPPAARERLLDLCAPMALLIVGGCWSLATVLGVALLAPALTGIPTTPTAMARFLLLRGDALPELLAVAGWLAVLVVLGLFGLHLTRLTSAYHRREQAVAKLAPGSLAPIDAELFLASHLRSGSWEHLDDVFAEWAGWLADIRTTHTGYPALTYYRPATELCWLDAVVLVLDAAALTQAVAPAWAPPNVHAILNASATCLPALSRRIGVNITRPSVSLQGREERGFTHSVRMAVVAGLPNQREYTDAWVEFQRWRTQYAPYVAAMRSRLLYAEGRLDGQNEKEPDQITD